MRVTMKLNNVQTIAIILMMFACRVGPLTLAFSWYQSFGEDLSAAALTTLHPWQMNVKTIIVKTPNEERRLVLEKVGAAEFMVPGKKRACPSMPHI